MYYNPLLIGRGPVLKCTFNATSDNLVAFTGATNITALKVNGTPIKIEPIKNENTTFDVLGENISLDLETGVASLPESYLIKSPVSSWSFKAKDPNYVINENTYACMLGMMDGMTIAEPMPLAEAMGYAFTTNDGVTLELGNEFLAEMNMQIQSGSMQVGFTLMDVDMNSGTLAFIDTEHQTNVTTGGLPTYSFDSEGFYNVEIELADSVISMQFAETPLISIEISDGVTTIESEAFSGCSGLTSIDIPDSVTSIGDSAFNSCYGLTHVTIGSGVTNIGSSAFQYCYELTGELVIPDSVTEIGDYAFEYCSDLTSVIIGSGVTSIGYGAISNCKGLTSITIPDSVTSIGDYAFLNCSGLTSINIPDSVTTIGEGTFQDCYGLTSINIPDGVTEIGSNAFKGCSGLTSLTLGSGLTTIGKYAFSGCTGSLYVDYNVSSPSGSGSSPFYSSKFISVEFGPNVTSIGDYAFYNCSSLTSVVLSDSVTSIGERAFSGCSKLTGELVIPDGVTSIGNYAFSGCKGLTEITLPDSVTTIGSYAFMGCPGVASITCLAPTAPNIQSYTFSDVKSAGMLYVPAGSTSSYSTWMKTDSGYLGSYAYNWFIQEIGVDLSEITLDDYDLALLVQPLTTTASTGVFGSSSLSAVTEMSVDGVVLDTPATGYTFTTTYDWHIVRYKFIDGVIPSSALTSNCGRVKEAVIGDSVTSIGKYAFQYCSGLTEVTIGSGVTSIGSYAFSGCTSMTGITIPDSVTSIGSNLFDGCSSLPVIDNIQYADKWAIKVTNKSQSTYELKKDTRCLYEKLFSDCASMTDITIPDSVTSIDRYAFSGCTSLNSITIGSGVTSIGFDPFKGCTSLPVIDNIRYADTYLVAATDKTLATYNIKEGTKFIGTNAFSGCTSLTGELVIPDYVTSIGDSAFQKCSGLTSIVIPDSVTEIGQSVFSGCDGLTSITIPYGVTSIGSNAFYNCTGLTGELIIPDSVTTIGNGTFENCSGLTGELVIPDSVTYIGSSAFQNCLGLTEVTIGSGVTSIGSYAFYGWSLTSIEIPASVTFIGGNAFQGCPLTSITCYATTAPSIESNTFAGTKYGGTLYVPVGSDYSSWMSTSYEYLGYQRWTIEYI